MLRPRWGLRGRSFINEFYDDEGWWASAWIDAHELTGKARYLNMAQRLYRDIQGGWSDDCGGGVFWKKGEPYKAAIANSLYMYIGARLYEATRMDEYLREAQRAWDWITGSGLVGSDGLVRDGLGRNCAPASDLWTYNQGMLIGAAVSLARAWARHDEPGAGAAEVPAAHAYEGPGESMQQKTLTNPLIEAAIKTAYASIGLMAGAGGVLCEKGEPDLSADSVQFKGILMRFLAELWRETADQRVAQFILANADSLWMRARKGDTFQVGACWRGPFDTADAARQGSALDALVAAATVESRSV